jgi:trans-aconitate methyltransferase
VGCGTGEPIAQFFIEQGYLVTGIDASHVMIQLCQQRFPSQRWLLDDMRTLHLAETFDLVIAWHSLFHLPPEDQRHTLKYLISHLKKGGVIAFTSGDRSGEVWGNNGGYDLYHASLSRQEYEKILTENHCRILLYKQQDAECGDATVWIAKNDQ